MSIKVKSMKVPNLDVVIFEFSDGMKARVLAVTDGWGGDHPSVAGFYLETNRKTIVQFSAPNQHPITMRGKGFLPVTNGYQNLTVQKIAEYILAAAEFAASKFKPGNHGTPNEIHAHFLMSSGTSVWQDIKNGKYSLPS